MRRRDVGRAIHLKDEGFSLVEMLLVLLIMALVSSLFIPTLRHGGREKTPASLARELQAILIRARTNAISRGTAESVHLDLKNREVTYAGLEGAMHVPESVATSLLVGRELLAAEGTASLLFLPDGGSTGARIVFSDQRSNAATVVVSWLSGTSTVISDRR